MRSGSANLSLTQPHIQLDPYKVDTSIAETISYLDLATPIPLPSSIGQNTLLLDLSLKNVLGYEGIDLNIPNIVEANFIATNQFDFYMYNDTYLVVLDNLRLESYDGFDGVERSILHTINVSDDNTNRIVQYETNTLDYIDLKNNKETNIRNIKGRIVRTDLKELKLNGIASLVLLIN